MLSVILGALPVIGTIFNGITSVFNKMQDTKVVQIQTDAQTRQIETQASASIIEATKDDIGLRIARDIVVYPVAIWTALIGWDNIVLHIKPEWVVIVEKYPDSVAYLPYAVLMFLLGNIGINAWSKR